MRVVHLALDRLTNVVVANLLVLREHDGKMGKRTRRENLNELLLVGTKPFGLAGLGIHAKEKPVPVSNVGNKATLASLGLCRRDCK